MHEFILTYCFEYDEDDEQRYHTVRNSILDFCQQHGGKLDESTSTIVFYSSEDVTYFRNNISEFYNENQDLIRDDVLCFYYARKPLNAHEKRLHVSRIEFNFNPGTHTYQTNWSTHTIERYHNLI